MSAIKAILVDFGGVLFTPGTRLFYKEHMKPLGVTEEQFKGIFYAKAELGRGYRLDKIDEKTFWEHALKKLNLDVNPKEYAEKWHSCFRINEELRDFLIGLKKKGYLILGATNNIIERSSYLEKKYSFAKDFDKIYFSFKTGKIKPDADYFEHILGDLKLKPEECVFIDDQEKNLIPARELGIKTILFEDVEQFKKELKEALR